MVSAKNQLFENFKNLMSRWMYTQDDNQRVYMSLILRTAQHWLKPTGVLSLPLPLSLLDLEVC
jgi:hypothetical protein